MDVGEAVTMFMRRVAGMHVQERRLGKSHEQAKDQAGMEHETQAF
jgi:hypothetical protein